MSTEQFYMRSEDWQGRPQEENRDIIERQLIPKLSKHAALLRSGSGIELDAAEEEFWIQKIAREKTTKAPKSLGCFLVTLFLAIAIIHVLFVTSFFF